MTVDACRRYLGALRPNVDFTRRPPQTVAGRISRPTTGLGWAGRRLGESRSPALTPAYQQSPCSRCSGVHLPSEAGRSRGARGRNGGPSVLGGFLSGRLVKHRCRAYRRGGPAQVSTIPCCLLWIIAGQHTYGANALESRHLVKNVTYKFISLSGRYQGLNCAGDTRCAGALLQRKARIRDVARAGRAGVAAAGAESGTVSAVLIWI